MSNMVIGVCQISLHLPGNRSLKGKRQVVRRICDRIRNRFHISIAEVGDLDHHQQSRLGLAYVGNESRYVQSAVEEVVRVIEAMQLANVYDRKIELVHFNEFFEEISAGASQEGKGWDFMESWQEEDEEPDWDVEAEEEWLRNNEG